MKKTNEELILVGLKAYKNELDRKITQCFKEWAKHFEADYVSLSDLESAIKDLEQYKNELSEVVAKIHELDPPTDQGFAADDIPF